MTTGVELWLSSARAARADGGRAGGGWVQGAGASFRETLKAQRAEIDVEEAVDGEEEEPVAVEEERVEAGEEGAEEGAEEAEYEPQVVREAQERLTGEDETLAEGLQAWESRRASMHAPEGGLHTAGAASASVVSGQHVAERGSSVGAGDADVAVPPAVRVSERGPEIGVAERMARSSPAVTTGVAAERSEAATAAPGGASAKGAEAEQTRASAVVQQEGDAMEAAPSRAERVVREVEAVAARAAVEAGLKAPGRGDRVEVSVGAAVASAMQGRGVKGGAMTSSGEEGERRDERGAEGRGARVEGEKAESGGAREVRVEAVRQEAPMVRHQGAAGGQGEVVVKREGAEGTALPGRDVEAEADVALAAARSASRAMSAMLRQRGGVMTMALSPESLGKVRIRMRVSGGCVEVEMATEHAEAGEALSRQLGALRESLEARGLRVERLDVRAAALAI